MVAVTLDAEPQSLTPDLTRAAIVVIDMPHDFIEPGG